MTARLLIRAQAPQAELERVRDLLRRRRLAYSGRAQLASLSGWLVLTASEDRVARDLEARLSPKAEELLLVQEPAEPQDPFVVRVHRAGRLERHLEYSPLQGFRTATGSSEAWEPALGAPAGLPIRQGAHLPLLDPPVALMRLLRHLGLPDGDWAGITVNFFPLLSALGALLLLVGPGLLLVGRAWAVPGTGLVWLGSGLLLRNQSLVYWLGLSFFAACACLAGASLFWGP